MTNLLIHKNDMKKETDRKAFIRSPYEVPAMKLHLLKLHGALCSASFPNPTETEEENDY